MVLLASTLLRRGSSHWLKAGSSWRTDAISQAKGLECTYVQRAIIGGSIVNTRSSRERKRNSCTLFTECGLGHVESICFVHTDGEVRCYLFLRKCALMSRLMSLNHAWVFTTTDALVLCKPSEVHGCAVVGSSRMNGRDVNICSRQPNSIEKD